MPNLLESPQFCRLLDRRMREVFDNAFANCTAPMTQEQISSMANMQSTAQQADEKIKCKAMKLLASKIGYKRMRQLKKKGFWEETSKYGVVRFHLNDAGGVSLIEKKKYGTTERTLEWRLCVQSQAKDLPLGDVILSRWMAWKADEDKFMDTANFREVLTKDEAGRR